MVSRRHFVVGGLTGTAALLLGRGGWAAPAQSPYTATKEILQQSRGSEADAYRQYVVFARQAIADGYPGIAYMFAALGTAELIHGQNFEKLLARLGIEASDPPQHPIQSANTRQNLIKAAADELNSVNTFYPDMLCKGYSGCD